MFNTQDEIKVGSLLVARNTFEYPHGGKALEKGHPYKVVHVDDNAIKVLTSAGREARFKFAVVLDYFSHIWND